MAVPNKRHTKSQRDRRRMHLYIKHPVLSICPKCKKPSKPYTLCWNCGTYKGEEVIDVLKKLTKKERKAKEREIAAKEKEEGKETKREGPLSWEEMSKK